MVLYLLGGALAQQRGEKRFSCFVGTRLPFSLLARVNHYSTAYVCYICTTPTTATTMKFPWATFYALFARVNLFYRTGPVLHVLHCNCITCVKTNHPSLPSQGFDFKITILSFEIFSVNTVVYIIPTMSPRTSFREMAFPSSPIDFPKTLILPKNIREHPCLNRFQCYG